MIGQAVFCTFPVSRVVTLKGGKGIWHVEVDGWMTSVQRFALPWFNVLVSHREMCPPTAHHSRSGDHLLGRCLCGRPFWAVLSSCSTSASTSPATSASSARQGPGVIPACSMQPASRPEASWPSALPARSIHVTPHRIARLECLYPGLVSSLQLPCYFYLTQVPYLTVLCPLLVSLGSAPGSRVARPRRNTATLASPPWLLMHGQWLMSFGPGGGR